MKLKLPKPLTLDKLVELVRERMKGMHGFGGGRYWRLCKESNVEEHENKGS